MKYIITFLLMGLTTLMNAQSISGDGIEVVEFNASFSSSKCEFLESLEDCETLRIDIFENTDAQKEHKISVVPSVVVFSDGVEVARFQANIMMVLEATQDEIQDAISEAIMNDF
jgi:hypothetical protein